MRGEEEERVNAENAEYAENAEEERAVSVLGFGYGLNEGKRLPTSPPHSSTTSICGKDLIRAIAAGLSFVPDNPIPRSALS